MLGIPLAPKKQAGPSTVIEFLGIVIDALWQELHLPLDKLESLQQLMSKWRLKILSQLQGKKQPSCTRAELDSLLGLCLLGRHLFAK